MNEINTIADIYLGMNHSRCGVIVEDTTDIDVSVDKTTGDQTNIGTVNIYIRPDSGPISRPYSGEVENITNLEDTTTIIARDNERDKLLQVISTSDDNLSVTVIDSNGRVEDTFIGKNIDFYDFDTDDDNYDLNIIKIENV